MLSKILNAENQTDSHAFLRVVQYTLSQRVVKLRTVRYGPRLVTRHRLSVRDMLAIEHRPPHLYECLWCHSFRTRNIVTLLSPVY